MSQRKTGGKSNPRKHWRVPAWCAFLVLLGAIVLPDLFWRVPEPSGPEEWLATHIPERLAEPGTNEVKAALPENLATDRPKELWEKTALTVDPSPKSGRASEFQFRLAPADLPEELQEVGRQWNRDIDEVLARLSTLARESAGMDCAEALLRQEELKSVFGELKQKYERRWQEGIESALARITQELVRKQLNGEPISEIDRQTWNSRFQLYATYRKGIPFFADNFERSSWFHLHARLKLAILMEHEKWLESAEFCRRLRQDSQVGEGPISYRGLAEWWGLEMYCWRQQGLAGRLNVARVGIERVVYNIVQAFE